MTSAPEAYTVRRMAKFARVIVDQSGSNAFDYEIPEPLAGAVGIGSRVRVPVRMRLALATVVQLLEETDAPGVRQIQSVVGERPLVSPLLIRLGHWMAEYYCCSLEAALRTVLPQAVRDDAVRHKTRLVARLAREVGAEEIAALEKRAPKQADVLTFLKTTNAPVPVAQLADENGASRATLDALARRGLVLTESVTVQRDPHGADAFLPSPQHALNAEQAEALAHVRAAISPGEKTADVADNADEKTGVEISPGGSGASVVIPFSPGSYAPKPILLHGVTGSGKTEIYLQAIQFVLELGKTAIVLVPEIALTPQTVERFKSRFADSQRAVAVLHSHLSPGERHDEWHKINNGEARIVIGARSAVFAPVKNLGLIVVDEEHENSYKQEETPHYHARDVAVLRGRMEPCAVLLGTATPSVESFHNTETGKYELLQLTQRVDERKMPRIHVVDMRMEAEKASGILSERLRQAVTARLLKKEQCILFLNRRGFNTSLICSSCGYVCTCPNCSIALTFHRAANRVSCHICGHTAIVPPKCPQCHDPRIKYSGAGTEKVEEAVARIFPEAVVRRMDADAMSRKDAYRETLHAFRVGKIDILVGTQMIAKGLDFPNVTLVGIINADLALHLPDFRASERTFQLLTQVAGRAGRGEVEGDVFVQTYTPFHPAIQFARHHDFAGFWEQEIDFRKGSRFPPFTHMTLITVRSPHETKAKFSAETLARRLREALSEAHFPAGTLVGDAVPAPLEKSRGHFRFHLMLRTRAIVRLTRALREVVEKLTFPEDVFVTVDVDPYQLL